jgi:hypothetical protein
VTAEEYKRQRRVLDQSLTAHTSLAQRLRLRQRLLTLSILVLSILATAFAFVGEERHIDVGFASASLPTWAGVLSTIVFALALLELVVTWGQTASRHEDAARRLTFLKGQFAATHVTGDVVDTGGHDLNAAYWDVMNTIEPIPNKWFVRLKAEHVRRIEQSKALDRAPTAHVWLIRLKLRLQGDRRLLSADAAARDEQPFLEDERHAGQQEE